ncbi:hypothetical protein B0T10DRAFT_296282 [Thelonectria olida]|uniref:Glycan binding protein Y3-like domain-containing protein n=1 Tax=Thelonectria olida TaxID=1576542 RepID=A0A9P8VPG0_9HYPO|nr:hypothetical protein B0T10DRAFT_296282 [Thelonectria olida]
MQPSTLLLFAVASLGFTSAATIPEVTDSNHLHKRKCFKTGQPYGNQQGEAQEFARTVCNNHFKGTWRKGDKVSRCYTLPDNKSVIFTVGLLGKNAGATRYLGSDECYDGLHKEVVNCSHGGETTYGNWYYRADPNTGICAK